MLMKQKILKKFKEIFASTPSVFFSPGRVNLIGEHLDYNGGLCLPFAIDRGTYAAAAKREDSLFCFYSLNFESDGVIKTDLCSLDGLKWAVYPAAVAKILIDSGFPVSGMDVVFGGSLPAASGLSSSASVELATAAAIKELSGLTIDPLSMAKLCQKAENQYVGVNCGILDQFSVAMGKSGCAMLLNSADVTFDYVPMRLRGYMIAVLCTNTPRRLQDSKYNERRSECESALKKISAVRQIRDLCDLKSIFGLKYLLSETELKRVKHVVSENMRVKKAVKALENGDTAALGRLMNESHFSLKNDYEVTGPYLDAITSASRDIAVGARMTGGGFGGCAIALVKESAFDRMSALVSARYESATGIKPDIFAVAACDGAKKIEGEI